MRLQSERLVILQECGLSETQARVYLTLIDYPAGTASSLAKVAQLPRNRLYESLDELNGIGLVDIILEEPRRYRARAIDVFVSKCATELRAKADLLDSRRAFFAAAFAPRTSITTEDHERGITQALTGRRAVAAEIERMIAGAEREIILAGSVGGSLRLAKHLMETRPPPDVAIELYAPATSAQHGGWEAFTDLAFVDVSWLEVPRATLCVIADRQELLRIHPVPDDERTHSGQDFALLTNNLAIIHDEIVGLRSLPRAAKASPSERPGRLTLN